MKKTTLFFFLGLIIIILSYTGSETIYNNEIIVNANSYEIIDVGWHPFSSVRVLAKITSQHNTTSKLIEIRIYQQKNVDYFINEDYEKATVFPENRIFIDSDYEDGLIYKIDHFEETYIILNNIIRASERDEDKELFLRIDVFQPFAYLRPIGYLILITCLVPFLKRYYKKYKLQKEKA